MIDFQRIGIYTDFWHMAGTATTITLISSLFFGDIPPPCFMWRVDRDSDFFRKRIFGSVPIGNFCTNLLLYNYVISSIFRNFVRQFMFMTLALKSLLKCLIFSNFA